MANHGGALQGRANETDELVAAPAPPARRCSAASPTGSSSARLHRDDDALRRHRRARAAPGRRDRLHPPRPRLQRAPVGDRRRARRRDRALRRAVERTRWSCPRRRSRRSCQRRTKWVAVTAASNAIGTVPDLRGDRRRRPRRRRARLRRRRPRHAAPPLRPRRRWAPTYRLLAYKWFGPHISVLCAAPAAARGVPPGQAQPVARRGAGPLGARHAAVRVAGGRARGGRVHARAGLRGRARPRGGPDGDRAGRPGLDGPRDALRRRRRPRADADVHRRGMDPDDVARRWPRARSPSGTATTTRWELEQVLGLAPHGGSGRLPALQHASDTERLLAAVAEL